jgi:hypothetical protein
MYFFPKIHKPDNPGRPIVSVCGCPTELVSSSLDDRVMALAWLRILHPISRIQNMLFKYTDPIPDYLGRYITDR